MNKDYDFSGWAARNDVLCSDGTTVRKGAFKHQDGAKVALVWGHQYDTPHTVVGHAILEDREEGTYAYGYLNKSSAGMDAKEAIMHKDIDSLSIYANRIKFGGTTGKDILHGVIRELSLVFAGADPTARIDYVLEHEESAGEGAIIYNGLVQDLNIPESEIIEHSEEDEIMHDEETLEDVINTMSDKQKAAMYAVVGLALDENDVEHAEKEENSENEETLEDVINTMSEKQKTALYALVGLALEESKDEDENNKENKTKDSEEDKNVKHNVFEDGTQAIQHNIFGRSDVDTIFRDARRGGSLKEAVMDYVEHSDTIAHAVTDANENDITYGVADIDWLFPEPKAVTSAPELITNDNGWVTKVINGVHKSPFSRIKTIFADATIDEARALGYTKGKLKKEEVIKLLKRSTDPQTIYKKQKLDRDDIEDISDFDVVAFLKKEMNVLLDEEKARAILVGDGRTSLSEDKIKEDHIRPIWTDDDFYTIKANVSFTGLSTNSEKADAVVDAAVRARKNYKGSGNLTFFVSETALTEMLLIKDSTGRKVYNSVADLAAAVRAKEIVSTPIMDGLTRTSNDTTYNLLGILVNLDDYTVGANKGGKRALFEDFDIDYNQMKYLIEDRCSGALTKPYSAIAIETTGTFAEG